MSLNQRRAWSKGGRRGSCHSTRQAHVASRRGASSSMISACRRWSPGPRRGDRRACADVAGGGAERAANVYAGACGRRGAARAGEAACGSLCQCSAVRRGAREHIGGVAHTRPKCRTHTRVTHHQAHDRYVDCAVSRGGCGRRVTRTRAFSRTRATRRAVYDSDQRRRPAAGAPERPPKHTGTPARWRGGARAEPCKIVNRPRLKLLSSSLARFDFLSWQSQHESC